MSWAASWAASSRRLLWSTLRRLAGRGLGTVIGICAVNEKDELMLINSEGIIIRMRVSDISVQGRYALGVKLINMDAGVTVAGMAKIAEEQLEEGEEV